MIDRLPRHCEPNRAKQSLAWDNNQLLAFTIPEQTASSLINISLLAVTLKMSNLNYYVYILTNKNHTVLYTGITNDLKRRMSEHQQGTGSKFTKRYNTNKLVYFEQTPSREAAILREKQIKAGSRQKKLDLISGLNAEWGELAESL